MHFITGAIKKTSVDKHDPILHRMDACREIGRGAPFLIHHADLDRVAIKAEQILNRVKQGVGKRGFFGAVHLWLDDIDAASAAVAKRTERL